MIDIFSAMSIAGYEQRDDANVGLQLFDHWERNQWAIRDFEPMRDRSGWKALPPPVRNQLRSNMIEFFVGEFSVTATLAPLAHAAPDKDAQIFLCTQLADEARHSVFFYRYLAMVDGARDSPASKLEASWPESSEGQVDLFDRRLRRLTERVRLAPGDLASWYEAITFYHFVLEGVLATSAQRVVLKLVEHFDLLPVLAVGLQMVGRDESRHVAFGVHTLRNAVAGQYSDHVLGVIKDSLSPLVRMVVRPERSTPELAHDGAIKYTVYGWDITRRALEKRLKAIGLWDYASDVNLTWCECFLRVLDEYEAAHDTPHPARERWLESVRT